MDFKRICNECGKEIKAGFVIDGGTEYYCCEKCLHKHYTEDEYLKMYDNGNSDTYWTEWEENEEGEDETINSDFCDTINNLKED